VIQNQYYGFLDAFVIPVANWCNFFVRIGNFVNSEIMSEELQIPLFGVKFIRKDTFTPCRCINLNIPDQIKHTSNCTNPQFLNYPSSFTSSSTIIRIILLHFVLLFCFLYWKTDAKKQTRILWIVLGSFMDGSVIVE
jgi:prolipoprotein diacylglyceryltransferase